MSRVKIDVVDVAIAINVAWIASILVASASSMYVARLAVAIGDAIMIALSISVMFTEEFKYPWVALSASLALQMVGMALYELPIYPVLLSISVVVALLAFASVLAYGAIGRGRDHRNRSS